MKIMADYQPIRSATISFIHSAPIILICISKNTSIHNDISK